MVRSGVRERDSSHIGPLPLRINPNLAEDKPSTRGIVKRSFTLVAQHRRPRILLRPSAPCSSPGPLQTISAPSRRERRPGIGHPTLERKMKELGIDDEAA